MDLVWNALNVKNLPQQPFCNVHPLITFQNKIKELCQTIHDKSKTTNDNKSKNVS